MWRFGLLQGTTERGKLRFPYVGLGLPLQLEIEDPEEEYARVRRTVDGPEFPSETIHVDVTVEHLRTALTGRVVSDDGKPVADQPLVLIVPPGPGAMGLQRLRFPFKTRDDGSFRILLEEGEAIDGFSEPVFVAVRDVTSGGSDREGRLAIEGPFRPGDTFLGEVALVEVPVAVSGMVVDEEQRPLADVEVRAWLRKSPVSRLGDRISRTGADGRFSIQWAAVKGELDLAFWRRGYSSREGRSVRDGFTEGRVSVPIGARDLVLVLTQTGGLAGSVLLDPGVSPEAIRVEVRSSGTLQPGRPRSPRGQGVKPGEDGSFVIEGVLPGKVAVQVMDAARSEALVTISDVTVKGGVTCRDPRLEGIDVRGMIEAHDEYVVKVVDAEGAPLEGAWVRSRHWARSETARNPTTGADGCLTLEAPGPKLRVTVGKRGFKQISAELAPGINEVTLDRPYTVQLKATSDSLPSCVNVGLSGLLRNRDGKRLLGMKERDPGGPWSLHFDIPGPDRYTLELNLSWVREHVRLSEGRTRTSYDFIEVCPPRVVEVKTGEYITQIEVPVPKEVLQEALKRAGSK
jgi:hypothetical protein